MKLELKRISGSTGPFALHVNGEIVPAQIETAVISKHDDLVKVVITLQSIPGKFDTVQIVGDKS